jgi:hypothetical protein
VEVVVMIVLALLAEPLLADLDIAFLQVLLPQIVLIADMFLLVLLYPNQLLALVEIVVP